MAMFRHGDLLIIRVDGLPDGATRAERQGDGQPGVVLEYGEVTGHAHRIKADRTVLWNANQQRYVTLENTADLSHEEHATIHLEAGVYQIIRQRTYTPEESRYVAD